MASNKNIAVRKIFNFMIINSKVNKIEFNLIILTINNRNWQDGSVEVDGGKPVSKRSPGKLRQLNTDTGLYVG